MHQHTLKFNVRPVQHTISLAKDTIFSLLFLIVRACTLKIEPKNKNTEKVVNWPQERDHCKRKLFVFFRWLCILSFSHFLKPNQNHFFFLSSRTNKESFLQLILQFGESFYAEFFLKIPIFHWICVYSVLS